MVLVRSVYNLVFLSLLAIPIGLCGQQMSVKTGKGSGKPNVIMIVADDLGYGDLGVYGQKVIKTPNLDRFSREGIRFTQYYAGSSVGAPSRCVLLTGNGTGKAYIRDNEEVGEWDSYQGQFPLPANTFTLGTLFQNAGYHTACIGKWGLGGPGSTGIPRNEGFDYFYGYLCQRQAHNHYPEYLWKNENQKPTGNPPYSAHQKLAGDPALAQSYSAWSGQFYASELFAEAAVDYITSHKDSSFFLFLAFDLPHLALQAPEKFLEQYRGTISDKPYPGTFGYLPNQHPNACYAAMVTALDEYTGQVLSCLASLGIDSNTLILFTSDNGATFNNGGYDPSVFMSNGIFRAGKATLYEGGIRVPLMARWPGKIKPGSLSDLPCAAWDFMSTFSMLTGQNPPQKTEGISLLPTLLGMKGQREHPWLYWEFIGNGGWQAVRTGKWKVVRKHLVKDAGRRLEVYDLERDPGEKINLAAKHPEIIQKAKEIFWQREPSANPKWNFTPASGRKRLKD